MNDTCPPVRPSSFKSFVAAYHHNMDRDQAGRSSNNVDVKVVVGIDLEVDTDLDFSVTRLVSNDVVDCPGGCTLLLPSYHKLEPMNLHPWREWSA